MMSELIGSYEYYRHSGSAPDRKVIFYRKEESVEAHVEAKSQGKWQEIAFISEKDILVQAESIAKQMEKFIAAIEGGTSPHFVSDKKLSEYSPEEKIKLICQLEPAGPFRLEIRSGIGRDPRFEAVRRIGFFIPDQKAS